MNEYNNFLFFGNWRIMLDEFYKDNPELAKEMCWQIMRYGTNKDIDTDNTFIKSILQSTVCANIDKSQGRYNSKVAQGGRPKIDIDINEILKLQNEGLTYLQIAERLNVSRNTIANRMSEYKNQKPNTKTKPQTNKNEVEVEVNVEEEVKVKEEVKTSSRNDFAMLMGLEV